MIPQKKALILRFFELESLRAWQYQEGTTPACCKIFDSSQLHQFSKFINVDFEAKIFLILYPSLENLTTCITIVIAKVLFSKF
jgi:hypothetical protein